MANIKELYENDVNIMQYFRQSLKKGNENIPEAIMISYDLQAGSYIKAIEENNENCNYHLNGQRIKMHSLDYAREFSKYVAGEIDNFEYKNVLEAGVGEATSFAYVVDNLKNQSAEFCGFDIAPSRIQQGKRYLEKKGVSSADLCVGNLLETPFPDNSFDIVYTIHAVEPNTNNAEKIIKELYRITNKYLLLFEPSFELGNKETKENITKHKYIKNLKQIVDTLNYKVIKYELTPLGAYANQPAIMIIEKQNSLSRPQKSKSTYSCPNCKKELIFSNYNFYCKECFKVYPVINDIPLLTNESGILFSQYLD